MSPLLFMYNISWSPQIYIAVLLFLNFIPRCMPTHGLLWQDIAVCVVVGDGFLQYLGDFGKVLHPPFFRRDQNWGTSCADQVKGTLSYLHSIRSWLISVHQTCYIIYLALYLVQLSSLINLFWWTTVSEWIRKSNYYSGANYTWNAEMP